MKKSLRKIILGTVIVAGISGNIVFKDWIDEKRDIAKYFSYFTRYALSDRPHELDIKVHQKMLRECGIINKYGEEVYLSPYNDMADELFFKNVDDFVAADKCLDCVKEQHERLEKAGRLWYKLIWAPSYSRNSKIE